MRPPRPHISYEPPKPPKGELTAAKLREWHKELNRYNEALQAWDRRLEEDEQGLNAWEARLASIESQIDPDWEECECGQCGPVPEAVEDFIERDPDCAPDNRPMMKDQCHAPREAGPGVKKFCTSPRGHAGPHVDHLGVTWHDPRLMALPEGAQKDIAELERMWLLPDKRRPRKK
jgi:hypothetical protein